MTAPTLTPNVRIEDPRARKIIGNTLGWAGVAVTAATIVDAASRRENATLRHFGARVEIVPNAIAHDPQGLLAHVQATGISVLESVPSLIQGMLANGHQALEGLRWMLPTGEAMPPELAGPPSAMSFLSTSSGVVPVPSIQSSRTTTHSAS